MRKLLALLMLLIVACEAPQYEYEYLHLEMRLVDGSIKYGKYKVPVCAKTYIVSNSGSYNLVWKICSEKKDRRFFNSDHTNNRGILKRAVIDYKVLRITDE